MEVNSLATHDAQAPEPTAPPAINKNSRKRNITVFALVSVANVALLALLWGLLLTPKSTATHSSDDTSGLGDISSPLIGRVAPDFSLPQLNGSKTVRLSDFKGKPVMVNFWASWCGPCQSEAPFLQQEASKIQSQGVTLLGVDGSEKSNADGAAFVQKYGLNFTNLKDTSDGATSISFGATGNPETFFINAQGVIVARWTGPLTSAGLQGELAKLHLS